MRSTHSYRWMRKHRQKKARRQVRVVLISRLHEPEPTRHRHSALWDRW